MAVLEELMVWTSDSFISLLDSHTGIEGTPVEN